MGNFLLGLFIGVLGCIVTGILVYKNNKKKINQALFILSDTALTVEQKIAKIKAFGI